MPRTKREKAAYSVRGTPLSRIRRLCVTGHPPGAAAVRERRASVDDRAPRAQTAVRLPHLKPDGAAADDQ